MVEGEETPASIISPWNGLKRFTKYRLHLVSLLFLLEACCRELRVFFDRYSEVKETFEEVGKKPMSSPFSETMLSTILLRTPGYE